MFTIIFPFNDGVQLLILYCCGTAGKIYTGAFAVWLTVKLDRDGCGITGTGNEVDVLCIELKNNRVISVGLGILIGEVPRPLCRYLYIKLVAQSTMFKSYSFWI
jgi:hypothetical protein